ncbi:Basement membrane-specific heparan sulfate proteoglycan core protein, partial [Temnothorax longispinosus]
PQPAAPSAVVRVGRRVLLGKSDRDDFRNFAAVAKRGLRYLAELELFGRTVSENVGDMKSSGRDYHALWESESIRNVSVIAILWRKL